MPYLRFRFAGIRRFGLRIIGQSGKVSVRHVWTASDQELPDKMPFVNGKPLFGPNVVVQMTSAEMVRKGHAASVQQARERKRMFPETTYVHPSSLWSSL